MEEIKYLYIYNLEQSAYYMRNGVSSVDCGVNPKTKMIWHKFKKLDTKYVYEKWLKKSELIKQASEI